MSRRSALRTLGAGIAGAAASLAACTPSDGPTASPSPTTPPPLSVRTRRGFSVAVLPPDPAAATALAVTTWFDRAELVVLARTSAAQPAADQAAEAFGVPRLDAGPTLATTLTALGTTTVLAYPDAAGLTLPEVTVLSGTDEGPRPGSALAGRLQRNIPDGGVVLLQRGAAPPAGVLVAARAAGATVVRAGSEDPRTEATARSALRAAPMRPVVVSAPGETRPDRLAARVRTTALAPLIPGGALLPFDDRAMVALYGHPSGPALGMLGERGLRATVARAKAMAQEHAPYAKVPVQPAFEIIATVAIGSPGPAHTYSRLTPLAEIEPWVDAAEAEGIYVVLDLQPGRADFLTQAKAYEPLLRRPGVGLALDPEWRLTATQKPLQAIGHVDVGEVNEVLSWLADLVRTHDLPPKVFTLHQFQTQMVRGRDRLDLDRDEVQVLVHVDGQGPTGAKLGTWGAMREGLPASVHLGWKNFVDEDKPMLSPRQTWALVHPAPSFVSYQ